MIIPIRNIQNPDVVMAHNDQRPIPRGWKRLVEQADIDNYNNDPARIARPMDMPEVQQVIAGGRLVAQRFINPIPDVALVEEYRDVIGGRIDAILDGVDNPERWGDDMPDAKPVLKPHPAPKKEDYSKMNIRELYNFKPKKGMFGVEVEVEGAGLPNEILPFFCGKEDGSLRGESREYVFIEPLDKETTLEAIDLLSNVLTHESNVDMSFRTSVHVHVNVLEMNKKQLCTYLYFAHLLEEPLVRFCGESRVGNRFCLRLRDASAKIQDLERLFNQPKIMFPEQNAAKYTAINIATVRKYGSVEFRSMRGTVDKEVLSNWIEILDTVRAKSLTFDSPLAVAEAYQSDPKAFFQSLFPVRQLRLLSYKGVADDIAQAFSYLITLPYEFNEEIL